MQYEKFAKDRVILPTTFVNRPKKLYL